MSEHSNEDTPRDPALEQAVGRALAGLPPRQAPASLESRVLQALALKAARPWWQLGFGRWPWGMRLVFGLICAVLAAASIPSSSRALAQIAALRGFATPWLQGIVALSDSMRTVTGSFSRSVPVNWLYLGLGASAALYAALFALAIAAYRLLYVRTVASE